MDAELLRRWTILQRLEEAELKNIAYVVIYGDQPWQNAIFIDKTSDEVYGVGSKTASKFKLPMIESFPSSGQKVKIGRLCGLGLEKIVVGSSLVGGLTKSGTVHIWYFPMKKSNEADAVIMFERYTSSNTKCACANYCRGYDPYGSKSTTYNSRSVGGVALNVCPKNSDWLPTYTAQSPPPSGSSVIRLVNSNVAKMFCLKCSRKCSSSKIGGKDLEYCTHCGIYPEYSAAAVYFEAANEKKTLHEQFEYNSFVDIACGGHYLALLSKDNVLILHGSILYHSFKSPVLNPDQIVIKSISCGSNHLAAISSQGELYTCGWGSQGQLGYISNDVDLTLHRVELEGVVVKVCCGHSATICLMLDGSVYCFGSNMKLKGKRSLLVNQLDSDQITKPEKIMKGQKFIDIANLPFTNKFFARTKSVVYSWGHKPVDFPLPEVIALGASSLMEVLVNHPIAVSCVESPSHKNLQIHSPHETDFSHLYGKKHLSDLVLKLSDGDFPVHSLVLFTRSTYFRENILQETASLPKELDMTSYNPMAYKALLQYFYQLSPDDLGCSDLVDLYLLATSYKEQDVLVDAYDKLKEKITADTVKLIHTKAKAANCKDLLHQCDVFMRTPEFQAKLLDVLARNTETTLSLL